MSLQLSDPTNGNPLGDGFGWRVTNGVRNFHHGQDRGFWSAKPDYRIYAAAPGRVLVSRVSPLLGNYVVTSVDDNPRYTILYAHFASRPSVNVGVHVVRRQQFATMGHTGSQAVGTHLHLSLLKDGVAIDPAPHFTTTAGGGGTEIPPDETDQEDEESDMDGRYLHRIGEATLEYMLVAPWLTPLLADTKQDGYRVTADVLTAQGWGAVYGTKAGDSWKGLTRDQYVNVQTQARLLAVAYRASHATVVGPGNSDSVITAVAGVSTQVTNLDTKVSNFPKPPTAEQNGAAAREAIVKT